MRIEKLQVKNFRGFPEEEVDFQGKSVLFFGKNGTGKSSLLHATVTCLTEFLSYLHREKRTKLRIKESDILVGKSEASVEIVLTHGNMIAPIRLVRYGLSRAAEQFQNPDARYLTDLIRRQFQQGNENVPVLVFYPVNRAVFDTSIQINNEYKVNQWSAYEEALTGGTNFDLFFEWYRYREDVENEAKVRKKQFEHEDRELKAVRQAIYGFLPGFSNLQVKRHPLKLVVQKGALTLNITQLSVGEKCLLAMAGDLARRLSIANPTLENPLLGTGICLIDEIELHLHPEWQREIIPRLTQTFPNIQFILSTHSPQVLGQVQDMHVYRSHFGPDGLTVTKRPTVYGKDSNRILEDEMESTARDEMVKVKLHELFEHITRGNWDAVLALKDELTEKIGTDDPELVKADILIRRKRSLDR